jgi:hypothetical protein
MKDWFARVIAYLLVGTFCLIGPLVLMLALVFTLQRLSLVYGGEHVEGTVVAKRSSGSTRVSYAPVFEFKTDDGNTVSASSDVYGPENSFRYGEHVSVVYRRGHPDSARIDTFTQMWTFPLVAGVVGAGFSVIPLLVWTGRRRQRLAAAAALSGDANSLGSDRLSAGLRTALAVLVIGAGMAALAAALGFVSTSTSSAHASRVPLGAVGVLLTSSGILLGQWVPTPSRSAYALSGVAVGSMSILFGWVALYGEASGFSGGVGGGGVMVSFGGSALIPRIAFGLVGIVFGLGSLWMWKRALGANPLR